MRGRGIADHSKVGGGQIVHRGFEKLPDQVRAKRCYSQALIPLNVRDSACRKASSCHWMLYVDYP